MGNIWAPPTIVGGPFDIFRNVNPPGKASGGATVGLLRGKSLDERETETMNEEMINFAETPLGVTEKVLHDKFRELIACDKYDEAIKVAAIMEKLSIV